MKLDDNSVLTACSKCMPKRGTAGDVHMLEVIGDRLICSNSDCRHDWTNWAHTDNKKINKD